MRESAIEAYLVRRVTLALGGRADKLIVPGRVWAPDRLVLLPGGRIFFVELKAPGRRPTEGQFREHNRLRDLGFNVRVIDGFEGVDRFIEEARGC